MKNLFSKILSWFQPREQESDLLRVKRYLAQRMDTIETRIKCLEHSTEMRLQSLEQTVHRLAVMLAHEEVCVTTDDNTIRDHFNNHIKRVVESELSINDLVESAIEDRDFSSDISDALDDAISNRDWDYELRGAIDWDKVADTVAEKLDWSEVISDNDIITRDELDLDDLMLKSEHMSDDDLVTRENLADMVSDQLKRDWFPMMVYEIVGESFDKKLLVTRQNAQANCVNAIDDEIENAVAESVRERMKDKFGPEFDNWFNENIRHTIKVVLGEFLQAAYEQTKNEGEVSNG